MRSPLRIGPVLPWFSLSLLWSLPRLGSTVSIGYVQDAFVGNRNNHIENVKRIGIPACSLRLEYEVGG